MPLILDDIIIIPVVVKQAVGDDMSLLLAYPTLSFKTDRLIMPWSCPVAAGTMVVGTILSNVVPGLALKTWEIWAMNWSWDWRAWCGVVTNRDVYVDWIFSRSCCISCCGHCFYIRDNSSNQPGLLNVEAPGILEDGSSLKDGLSGTTKIVWVGRGGNLWWGESGRDQLIRWEKRCGVYQGCSDQWRFQSLWWWRGCPPCQRVEAEQEWWERELRIIAEGWGQQCCWSRDGNPLLTSLERGEWGLVRLPSWAGHWQCRQTFLHEEGPGC